MAGSHNRERRSILSGDFIAHRLAAELVPTSENQAHPQTWHAMGTPHRASAVRAALERSVRLPGHPRCWGPGPGILRRWEAGSCSPHQPPGGAVALARRWCAAGGPRGPARSLQDVRAPPPAAGEARDPPLLVAVLQRPAVPRRGLRDRELCVLGGHQRGGRGAGQRLH